VRRPYLDDAGAFRQVFRDPTPPQTRGRAHPPRRGAGNALEKSMKVMNGGVLVRLASSILFSGPLPSAGMDFMPRTRDSASWPPRMGLREPMNSPTRI